jgi:hypothetical protein
MNDCHWYPRNPQKYLTDTQWCDHATEVAHVRLIDSYYALGRPIKDEPSRIQNIGKIKDADYQRVRGNLFELGWSIVDGFWRHGLIEETMTEMEQNRKSQIERTKAATEARQAKRNEERNEERNVVPITTTTTTTNTTKETETKSGAPLREFSEKLKTSRVIHKWQVWMNVRRGMKKPKDWSVLFNEQIEWLEKFDEPTVFEILSASIRNGWRGLFEPKNIKKQRPFGGCAP